MEFRGDGPDVETATAAGYDGDNNVGVNMWKEEQSSCRLNLLLNVFVVSWEDRLEGGTSRPRTGQK